MNKNHIFVDTNVLIGASVGTKKDSDCLHYLYGQNGKKLYTSSLAIAQLVSVLQKKKTNDEIRKLVNGFLHRFTILSFVDSDIPLALNTRILDIEDSIQYIISNKAHCCYFITNNIKDYRGVDISPISPLKVRVINS